MAGLPARLRLWLLALVRSVAHHLFALPGYRYTLLGRTPAALVVTPSDLWAGDTNRGAAVLTGTFEFAGVTPKTAGDIWAPSGITQEWLAELHGFAWLRDLRALGGDDARQRARRLAADWIAGTGHWSLPAWRSDVLATRLSSWLCHYETFFASGDDDFRRQVVTSIAGQLRHLDRAIRLETRGTARISALKARILANLCLGADIVLERDLRRLERETERQVLADGGHVSRSPKQLLAVLRDLLEVRAALASARHEFPGGVQAAIDRMAPMLRYLRHADGGLARFNGAGLEDPAHIEAVAEQASPRGKPAVRAPAMGFERLTSDHLTVLVDCGAPPPPPWDDGAHAGTFSIEVCAGPERLIVNCGAAAGDRQRWRDAERATAAHSTVVVNDRNSSELLENGGLGQRCAAVSVERDRDDGTIALSMRHEGYARSDGIIHTRRLILSADSDDLHGEDILSGPDGIPFALRFHLHPSVRASLLQSGRAALLVLPGGDAWRLAADAPMDLAESIYFENAPDARRTRQIVIAGASGAGSTSVKWTLHREARRD